MAMPRPSGRAQDIAEQVIPGLARLKRSPTPGRSHPRASLSEVEIKQTNQINNKERFR
jgi:hypothetical protein